MRQILEGPYDLAVVGGGINGCGIAHDACRRGKSVILLEREDFSYGTSSQSSKMLHGGLRYLEQFHFGLVFEALRERRLLLRLAPHLCRPQEFVIPIYEGDRRDPGIIRLGLMLYNLLCLGRNVGRGRLMDRAEVLTRVPELLQDGLVAGGLYYDVVMDDARLCLANVLAAQEAASTPEQMVAANYMEVTDVRPGSPAVLQLVDRIEGREHRIYAHQVVRALGPWTDPEHIVRSKGVHLILPSFPMKEGLLLTHSEDGRVFFLIPWMGRTVIGTTETPFDGDSGELRVEPSEAEYLIDEVRRLFPGISISTGDILGTLAGVRPLARSHSLFGGKNNLGKVSRMHRVVRDDNILTVFGGKYTTYRAVARDVVDKLYPGSSSMTHRFTLPGGEAGDWNSFSGSEAARVARQVFGTEDLERLYRRYGSRSMQLAELVRDDATLGERLVENEPEIRAEVVYGVRHEHAIYPEDFLRRRTTLRFSEHGRRAAYDAVEALIREHSQVVPQDLEAAKSRYLSELDHEDALRSGAPTL